MPGASIIGDTSIIFGVQNDEGGLKTESISVSKKKTKKQARNNTGSTVAVALYDGMMEIKITGYGKATQSVGQTLGIIGNYGIVGAMIVDQIDLDFKNEDFVKSTITGVAYELIT